MAGKKLNYLAVLMLYVFYVSCRSGRGRSSAAAGAEEAESSAAPEPTPSDVIADDVAAAATEDDVIPESGAVAEMDAAAAAGPVAAVSEIAAAGPVTAAGAVTSFDSDTDTDDDVMSSYDEPSVPAAAAAAAGSGALIEAAEWDSDVIHAGVADARTGMGVAGLMRRLRLWVKEAPAKGEILLLPRELDIWISKINRWAWHLVIC